MVKYKNSSRLSEYKSWKNMIYRCHNQKKDNYNAYGGRGIIVCERWLKSYDDFIEDMGLKPTQTHTIDRIDNHNGYFKENCRWATPRQQQNNRRCNRIIKYMGEKRTASEWALFFNIPIGTVFDRLNKGFNLKRVFSNKNWSESAITYNGETQSYTKWAKQYGINKVTFFARIKQYGWDIEKALNTKTRKWNKNIK